jgi:hypothetical protein
VIFKCQELRSVCYFLMLPISVMNRLNGHHLLIHPVRVSNHFHQPLLVSLIYDTLMLLSVLSTRHAHIYPPTPQKTSKNAALECPMMISMPIATSGFHRSPGPPPSGDVLDIIPADRQGQRNGQQVWYFFIFFYSACNPVVRRGNTT